MDTIPGRRKQWRPDTTVDYGKVSVPWCDHKRKGKRWQKVTNKRADEFLPWCSLELAWEAVSGTLSLAGKHVGAKSYQSRRGSAKITFSSPRICMGTFADSRKSAIFSSALELAVKGANSFELNGLLLSLLPRQDGPVLELRGGHLPSNLRKATTTASTCGPTACTLWGWGQDMESTRA